MYSEVLSWGERDDAFFSYTFCETIGWKSEDAAPGPEDLSFPVPL
jgi:hypothetical protein